jgi:hypothetical protein
MASVGKYALAGLPLHAETEPRDTGGKAVREALKHLCR